MGKEDRKIETAKEDDDNGIFLAIPISIFVGRFL